MVVNTEHMRMICVAVPCRRGDFEMNVANKVALVTGASRGIGRAMALYFAQQGAAAVVLADGRFLILPHPEVADHMPRLRRRFAQDGASGENHAAG